MKRRHILLLAFAVMVLDQASKYLASSFLPITTNTGAAFGLFQHAQPLLTLITLLVILWILSFLRTHPYPELGLILGGSAGNLIDRVIHGQIIDFIHLPWWPRFNIADACISAGAALLFLRLLRKH